MLISLKAGVNGLGVMQNNDDGTLRELEQDQQALKRNIEESARLIDQAEDAIQRFRGGRDREPAAA